MLEELRLGIRRVRVMVFHEVADYTYRLFTSNDPALTLFP
jgi:hypothetical protein